jgi:glycosyltransferase involved in cell wall biosynthesis
MNAQLPKISVITPTLNQVQFIEATIRSVLGQGYPNLEYLILDGGSTDGTVEILRKYEGERLHWISQKDGGQSNAINQGFHRATGDILAYLNSDDLYEPGALHAVGGYFARHPEAGWVTGKCRIIDGEGREIRRPITAYKNFWLRFGSYRVLQVLDYISQPATFWARRVIDRVGLLDEHEHLSMDYDYSLRVGVHFPLCFINTYLASFRVHPASKSRKIREHFNSDLMIARRYSNSRLMSRLHQLHNDLIVVIYERL